MVQPELGLVQLRRLSLLSCAALIALGGCICNQDLCIVTNATPVTLSFATAWQPVTVTALLPVSCGTRVATSVTVSVLDPSSNPVMHTKTDPRTTQSGFEVDITFTPTAPGTYHLAARFDPNFGTAQSDVMVAAERRDAGSVLVSGQCDRGDFTPSGLTLCTNANGTTLEVLDAGQFISGRAARWGSTLWTISGNTVQRFVEDGGAFELTGAASGSGVSNYASIVPGPDDALFRKIPGVDLWTDGGLSAARTPASLGTNLVWRSGTNVAFVVPPNRWCSGEIPGDGGERCNMLTSPTVVGVAPEGLWLQNETMMGLEVLLVDHRVSTGFALPPGWAVINPGPFQLGWDNGVLLDGGSGDAGPFVLRRQGDSILLENYGPRVQAITSTCVTVPEGSSTRLYRR